MKAILLRKAEADIEAIADFLTNESPWLAHHFIDAYSATVELLVRRPGVGHVHVETRAKDHQQVRCIAIEQFSSYLLFYQVRGEVIEIVRIVHGARDIGAAMDSNED